MIDGIKVDDATIQTMTVYVALGVANALEVLVKNKTAQQVEVQ